MEDNSHNIDNLILSFLNGDIPSGELKELRKWVKESPENKDYFKKIEDCWLLANVSSERNYYNKDAAYERFVERTQEDESIKRQDNIRQMRRILSYAASIVIALTIGFSAKYIYDTLNVAPPLNYTLEAPRRAKLKVNLPDGSTVWLNADSKLTYNNEFGISNRKLALEGEGYFDISRNSELPLEVVTGKSSVNVLGTKFNIRNYNDDDELWVSLLQGKVNFCGGKKLKPVTLSPNEMVIYNKRTGMLTLKEMNKEYMNAWIKNDVIFNEERLENIAKVLERSFDVKIKFRSVDLKNLIFYGNITLEADNVEQVMDMMASTNKFNYKYNIDKREIEIFH